MPFSPIKSPLDIRTGNHLQGVPRCSGPITAIGVSGDVLRPLGLTMTLIMGWYALIELSGGGFEISDGLLDCGGLIRLCLWMMEKEVMVMDSDVTSREQEGNYHNLFSYFSRYAHEF